MVIKRRGETITRTKGSILIFERPYRPDSTGFERHTPKTDDNDHRGSRSHCACDTLKYLQNDRVFFRKSPGISDVFSKAKRSSETGGKQTDLKRSSSSGFVVVVFFVVVDVVFIEHGTTHNNGQHISEKDCNRSRKMHQLHQPTRHRRPAGTKSLNGLWKVSPDEREEKEERSSFCCDFQ